MLLLVLRWVDLQQLKADLLQVPLWVGLTVLLGYLLGQVISAYKWWLLARSTEISVSFSSALKAYFIGMFVNCFAFGIVGGDVARGLLLAEGQRMKAPAIATVVADRAHGLAVLALLGVAATILFESGSLNPAFIYLLYVIGGGIVLGWYLAPKLALRFIRKENRFRKKIEQIQSAFPTDTSTVIAVTAISVCFHLLQIALHGVMAAGLGATVPWTLLLVTIPFVNILSSLPISWMGLGVREYAYIFFLTPLILTREQAVVLGAIWLLAVMLSSAIGGIVAVMTKDLQLLSKKAETVVS